MGALKSKCWRSKSNTGKANGENSSKGKKQKKEINLPESQSARKTVDPRLPFSNYRQIFSIRNAWKAIQRSLEDCAMETLLRFLNMHPQYREMLKTIKNVKADEEDGKKSEIFKDKAMDIYNIFDGVITNLETVDKALEEIEYGAQATEFTQEMFKDYQTAFIEIIRLHLGSERFTETTEDNFKLLYKFVQDEVCKYIDGDNSREVHDTEIEVNLCSEDAT